MLEISRLWCEKLNFSWGVSEFSCEIVLLGDIPVGLFGFRVPWGVAFDIFAKKSVEKPKSGSHGSV